MLPSPDFKDFVNDKFVYIKYNLDLSDVDNIIEKFDIDGYPTFLFLDSNGKELTRLLGASNDAKKFIATIDKALLPENTIKGYEEKIKNDPSQTISYAVFLEKQCGKSTQATQILVNYFENCDINSAITKENREIVLGKIKDINSPILSVLVKRGENVETTNKSNYTDLMQNIGDKLLSLHEPFFSDDFKEIFAFVDKVPTMQTQYYKFLRDKIEVIKQRDKVLLYSGIKPYLEKCNTYTRSCIVKTVINFRNSNFNVNFDKENIKLNNTAAQCESDSDAKNGYKEAAKKIKKPITNFYY